MRQHSALFIASFLCFATAASAAPITYQILVDSSSIAGTAGSLDFNFDPGPLTFQFASLQILNFTSDGTLAGCPTGGPCPTGDVDGQLPSVVTFDNGTEFNDYFEGFTFGTTISFNVSLYGPALSAPDGVSASGSTFAFSMFSDGLGTIPVLTSDTADGFAVTVGVNLDGTTTVTDFSAQTVGQVSPEPGALSQIALAIGLWIAVRFWRQRRQANWSNTL
jgi:hypothetical protein